LGWQFTFPLQRLEGFKSGGPVGRQLDTGQALKPFPEGIIYRHTIHSRQLPGQRLLNDFGSGASGPTSESIAQQLFSLRCEGNFHQSSIAEAGMDRTRIPWNRAGDVALNDTVIFSTCVSEERYACDP